MKRISVKTIRNVPWPAIVLSVLVSLIFLSAYSKGQVNTQNPLIKEGEFPPDFELPRLTFRTNESGKTAGVIDERDTVRLSSFRGKKPVCLIMSSYT